MRRIARISKLPSLNILILGMFSILLTTLVPLVPQPGRGEELPGSERLENSLESLTELVSLAETSSNGKPDLGNTKKDKYESLAVLTESSKFRRIGRNLALVAFYFKHKKDESLPTDWTTCTGSVVSPKYILTARHCLIKDSDWSLVKIGALVNFYKPHKHGGEYAFRVTPVEEDKEFDYALLEIQEGASIELLEYLDLGAAEEPSEGKSSFIVHHPGKTFQRLSRWNCVGFALSPGEITGQNSEHRFGHRCETEPGSSGSIIFSDDDGNFVPVALHVQGGFETKALGTFSLAVPLLEIVAHSEKLKKLADNSAHSKLGGFKLPFYSANPCSDSDPKSFSEVARILFGPNETGDKKKEALDLRAVADSFAFNPLWITEVPQSTRQIRIPRFLAFYFQGKEHFLKIQQFPKPAGGKQLRAYSFAGYTAGSDDVEPTSWVFINNADGQIIQIRPVKSKDGPIFPIKDVRPGSMIYVVTVYLNTKAMLSKTGAEEIWIEMGDLAGQIGEVNVIFGGIVKDVIIDDVFEMIIQVPQKFCMTSHKRRRWLENGPEVALKELGNFMTGLMNNVVVKNKRGREQPRWNGVNSLWSEFLKSKENALYSGLTIKNVKHDLLLVARGSPIVGSSKTLGDNRE